MYCPNLFQYNRRKTTLVNIGNKPLGGDHPIRIQSMTNTSTMDTEGSVAQCKRIIDAGADYVRLTAQGVREAENLANIRTALLTEDYDTPLIADIHFNPKAAHAAALTVQKVRINPGNYVDPSKSFAHYEYTEEAYALELQKIRDRFIPFIQLCRENGTAIRIGVNHGSLSDRILSRYGDTPAGMVESCMEFLRLCMEENFTDVAISMKSSNVLVMVQAVRLLVERMNAEDIHFPLHLGVTEAGDGEAARIKSSVGIGSLLMDGIGDTIRVSLSEDPELEVPVARQLVQLVEARSKGAEIDVNPHPGFDPFSFHRRETDAVGPFGGGQVPVVVADVTSTDFDFSKASLKPDFVYVGENVTSRTDGIVQLCEAKVWQGQSNVMPIYDTSERKLLETAQAPLKFLRISLDEFSTPFIQHLKTIPNLVLMLQSEHTNTVAELRAAFHALLNEDCRIPVLLFLQSNAKDSEEEQLLAGLLFGSLLIDGFGDGVYWTTAPANHFLSKLTDQVSVMFGVLQSTRMRISKTEYISCPSCGRTLFDLQKVIAQIKERTSHLKGLKIGIMGCIVNGPGEMADADYGYVGAGRGHVSLYKGQNCVERSIPTEQALDKLIELIKAHGDWKDPEN
ncbi:MAG TPA: 4-hydroxy-3-methylbut-2-en-1-yl diphosphate synthase [Bacteroidales bacterium]|nr:4-hydroxy-3-methylbut-2-en-1-yl diphosphate synthase [Bacteroidales bacterium]